MTDLSFALFIVACGILNLGMRFLPDRLARLLLVPLLATLLWGLAHIVFRVRLLLPVGQWTEFLLVFAGIATILTSSFLDFRARRRASQAA